MHLSPIRTTIKSPSLDSSLRESSPSLEEVNIVVSDDGDEQEEEGDFLDSDSEGDTQDNALVRLSELSKASILLSNNMKKMRSGTEEG